MDKVNLPENSIIYLNQGYQSYKDNKRVYYGDYFLAQVNECLNPPEDFENYKFRQREVKMFRPRYDTIAGKFKGLYETLGYLMVCGDMDEHFLNYGFSKQISKILHLFHKNLCLVVSQSRSLTDIIFNMNRGLLKRTIPTLTSFF